MRSFCLWGRETHHAATLISGCESPDNKNPHRSWMVIHLIDSHTRFSWRHAGMLSLGSKTYPEQLIFSAVVKYITQQFLSDAWQLYVLRDRLMDGGAVRKTLITCSLFTVAWLAEASAGTIGGRRWYVTGARLLRTSWGRNLSCSVLSLKTEWSAIVHQSEQCQQS